MYISEIYIENIRCFSKPGIKIKFETSHKPTLWTTILGDNSTGKTTLLKCIALGLCDESSAAGLLTEADLGYIRKNCNEGKIVVKLRNPNNKLITVETSITKQGTTKTPFENLRRTKDLPESLWDELFICAYGIGRGTSGAGDVSGYSIISAVYNLFNYSEGLQNPELVLSRLTKNRYKSVCKCISKVLDLKNENAISQEATGIKLELPSVGKIALRDLADGYRATFLWLTDFLGWAFSHKPSVKIEDIQGIVLVDALEEHLHPNWQRMIVSRLHQTFKKVQFISTTHSPLVASGTVDFDNAQLIELELKEGNKAEAVKIDNKELKGMRADQVLRSKAFGLPVTASPHSISDITEYYELQLKKKPTEDEQKKLKQLKKQIAKGLVFGDTPFEIEVEKAVQIVLEKMLKKKPSEIHRLASKRKLHEIFKDNK